MIRLLNNYIINLYARMAIYVKLIYLSMKKLSIYCKMVYSLVHTCDVMIPTDRYNYIYKCLTAINFVEGFYCGHC